ncbi:MAG: hypothetical protein RLZZ46_541 [Bacteroidota bacterium]|jgi:alpha-glucosidase
MKLKHNNSSSETGKGSKVYRQRVNSLNKSLGEILHYRAQPFGLNLETSDDVIDLLTYDEGTLRIRIRKKSSDREDFSYAVNAQPRENLYKLSDREDELVLTMPAFVCRIQKKAFRIAFYSHEGKLINADEESFGTSRIGNEVTTYKKIHKGERFIGMGEKTGNLDRRGKTYTHWNTDHFAYGINDDPLYLSTPFYIGIKDRFTYGIFLDNTYKSVFNFGASNDRFMYFQADDGEMNYYFIHRSDIRTILESYTGLTGRMSLPPLWSLGFQQCRYSYYPDTELLNIARTFREKKIPADVIYLDIHYMDAYKVFTWHPERFPDPRALTKKLKELGFNTAVILDPGIKKEKGYLPYEEGLEKDLFVKYPDGKPYAGEVWPGWSCFPDFTSEEVRKWWGDKLRSLVQDGVTGFWNDMNEPAAWGQHLPDLIEFEYDGEGATHKKARNVYGMQMARSTYEGALKLLKGKRPFVLTRAGFSGIQRYAAVWTGDNVSDEQHMLAGIRMINALGLAGISNAGYDVGGFCGEAAPELMARWISVGAFCPFFRAHSMINSRDAEPWAFGEETEEISRNYIRLRYRLMPYIYSMFYESTRNGMPVARSLAIDYTFDDRVYDSAFQNQYLFGDSFLVIPALSTESFIKVFLPSGKWLDFYTDKQLDGGTELIAELKKEKLPLYVKAGSIIPMQSQLNNLKETPEPLMHLHVYGGGDGEIDYYEDDGETYAYGKGDYFLRKIRLDWKNRVLFFDDVEGKRKSKFKKIKIYFHSCRLETVRINGKSKSVLKENVQFIEPISAFDPFIKNTTPDNGIKDLPVIIIDNPEETIKILFN